MMLFLYDFGGGTSKRVHIWRAKSTTRIRGGPLYKTLCGAFLGEMGRYLGGHTESEANCQTCLKIRSGKGGEMAGNHDTEIVSRGYPEKMAREIATLKGQRDEAVKHLQEVMGWVEEATLFLANHHWNKPEPRLIKATEFLTKARDWPGGKKRES